MLRKIAGAFLIFIIALVGTALIGLGFFELLEYCSKYQPYE